ncbi:MAG: hypothetical protein ACJ74O_07295 [Frankiaceae bacterium]
MADPSMITPGMKLHWAATHMGQLWQEMGTFVYARPYEITYELDIEAPEYVFYVDRLQIPPPHWALLFGDFVHNLRAALDHLAYQLALRAKPGIDSDAKASRRISFPIVDTPTEFKNAVKPILNIGALRDEDRERIEELQPYNAQNVDIWGPAAFIPRPIPHYLRLIRDFDNADKHRLIKPVWYTVGNPYIPDFPEPYGTPTVGVLDGPLVGGAKVEIGRWTFDKAAPEDLPEDLNLYNCFPIEPRFEEYVAALFGDIAILSGSLQLTMRHMQVTTESVLHMFAPAVVRGATPLPAAQFDPANMPQPGSSPPATTSP